MQKKYTLRQAAEMLGITRSGVHYLLKNNRPCSLLAECEKVRAANGAGEMLLIPAETLKKIHHKVT